MKAEQVGLQLYTVRGPAAEDFAGTLRAVAAMGYRAVELAGYGGMTVPDLRRFLDELGLRAIGAHVAYARFVEGAETVLEELRTLGCDFAIIPALPTEQRADLEAGRQAYANFNRWGELTQAAGLRFGYHNHAFEFASLPGGTLFEALIAETDPALVALELDLFWALYGGADPVALTKRFAGRVPVLHLKDMAPGEERADAPVGEGILPWSEILPAGAAAGTEWYIVEQDHPRSPLDDVRTSLRNLERMAED